MNIYGNSKENQRKLIGKLGENSKDTCKKFGGKCLGSREGNLRKFHGNLRKFTGKPKEIHQKISPNSEEIRRLNEKVQKFKTTLGNSKEQIQKFTGIF